MADQVDVPKVGPVNKKWVLVVVAGGATFVGIAWFRKYQGNKAAGTAVADPTTGSVGASGVYANPAPVIGNDSVDQPPAAASTNQQWTARVIADLGNIGLDASYVSAVIGKYLAGQQVTNDEASVIRQAWAFEGKPPGGPNFINLGTGSSTPGTPAPPPPATVPPGETPHPTPKPTPAPTPTPAPAVRYVATAKFTSKNPPWNSTLSGIAGHEHTTVAALLKLNPSIHNANLIPYPGQIRVA